jgi:hypothetical protein
MKAIRRVFGFIQLSFLKQSLVSVSILALLFATWPQNAAAQDQDQYQNPRGQGQASQGQASPYTQQTPEQIQQMVAPIALYPDSLVAQILAASTFPEQVVEADRWVQDHQNLKGDDLAQAVDQMPWDPSVKALTAFPSVLGNMDKNLSWTSSLGDAYYNQQQDVMDAVQLMRQKAEAAGNLKSTPQQTVTTQGPDVVIQPTNPEVVYVPAYNPWAVYGYPVVAWPGWYPYPGIWYGGPYLSFGVGFGIGFFGGFGWGWGHWGVGWHEHAVFYNQSRYYSHSNTFYNRNAFYRGGNRYGSRPGGNFNGRVYNNGGNTGRSGFDRSGTTARPFNGDNRAARGYAPQLQTAPQRQTGTRSGAFSGFGGGGQTRGYSSRGSSSYGGGGGSRGGGGGHGGGGHR